MLEFFIRRFLVNQKLAQRVKFKNFYCYFSTNLQDKLEKKEIADKFSELLVKFNSEDIEQFVESTEKQIDKSV